MRLIEVFPDSFIFEEPHGEVSGKNQLTISCHGLGFYDGRPWIAINRMTCSPMQLFHLIQGWTDIKTLHSVRLAACKSANSNSNKYMQPLMGVTSKPRITSFASKLSIHLGNVYVMSYEGWIFTTCDEEIIWNRHNSRGEAYTKNVLERCFMVIKDNSDYHYHCVIFLNGRIVEERYPIQNINGQDFACL
ncbi:hypothetical protein [Xenorhabdus bharatensis]|uniref:hypothetical protein n=1 Tax=Xenorhabdus bharatensis TaxID=3136256 RepID=UPI0030F37FF2